MFLRNKKTDSEIFVEQLYATRELAYHRFEIGHMDRDGSIRRTLNATNALIAIWDPQEEENEV